MGPLVGIIGCLYRIVRLHRTDLLPPFILAGLPSRWDLFEDDGLGPGSRPLLAPSRSIPPFMATLAFLKGRSLREFWLKKFDPLNPANCSRERVSKVLAWLYAQAKECRLAGVYHGRFPFASPRRVPAGTSPTGYTPPLPNTTGVPKTTTTSGAPTTSSASGVQSTFPAPEVVDLLSDSATVTDEETVAVDL
ncbi:hypothetical protein H257_18323 [Aphanomyces astaci]|uniref:Uncharacterized protein n=1 Tax=Aphanomyces astaci TaxID=112090 RepID=W4FBH9_APHAT|nr:hypothetical protein H257_18323 [Aphanomyces astaci]ETV64842.1 hypothetical protein H257_18323 [Aphanomyces astaci]|eukprot:XP_009845661.1 hypothetical protein H257_18323 [Aphanomyces astaci]